MEEPQHARQPGACRVADQQAVALASRLCDLVPLRGRDDDAIVRAEPRGWRGRQDLALPELDNLRGPQ
eukprot:7338413-Pyramimonas_sp.AAC.1